MHKKIAWLWSSQWRSKLSLKTENVDVFEMVAILAIYLIYNISCGLSSCVYLAALFSLLKVETEVFSPRVLHHFMSTSLSAVRT